MKILVTGAAGFLGGHVARYLAAAGHDVTGLDRVAAPDPDFESTQADLLDLDELMGAFTGQEAICHLAAIGDVYLAAERPELAAAVNVTGSANVARAAEAAGARVVYASTWEVYGEPEYEPLDEVHPCRPDHPYNITKLAGERMLLAAAELRGIPVTALRLGTAFGSGLRPNSVFRIFVDRARRGDPITIQGDGSQGRQFTHVRDISKAFELASRSEVSGEVFNIVAAETTSIRRLAELVVRRYPTELTFGDPRPGDIAPARVSSAKASDVLGWSPIVAFEEGLEDVFAEAEAAAH